MVQDRSTHSIAANAASITAAERIWPREEPSMDDPLPTTEQMRRTAAFGATVAANNPEIASDPDWGGPARIERQAVFDEWLARVLAEAWDAGYRGGNLDGYFGERKHKNPHRPATAE